MRVIGVTLSLCSSLYAFAAWPAPSSLAEAARTGDLAAIRALLDTRASRSADANVDVGARVDADADAGVDADADADTDTDADAAVDADDDPRVDADADAVDIDIDIDAAAADGMTALLWASQANDIELVSALLAAGADPNLGNRYGITPLWLAATNRSPPLVELLLASGADARAAMAHGETALMAAARAGDAASIDLLIAAGADPNASETAHGETALIWAAAEDHADAIRALVRGGADPDARAKELKLPAMTWEQTGMVSTVLPVGGWTALMYAARQDSRAAVRALAESGADLDAQEPDGLTALTLAIINGHYDLAALLLDAGADPDVADRTGMTALYAAVDMATQGNLIGLPARPRQDRLDAIDVVRLALDHGADPNARLTSPLMGRHHNFGDRELGAGATALMRAAKGRDLDSMRLLLEAGADASATLADGSNVLFFLASANASNDAQASAVRGTLDLVLEAGANVSAVGRNGETALHRAARRSNAVAVQMLLEHGARADVRDSDGATPLDLVPADESAQSEEIRSLLRSASARSD